MTIDQLLQGYLGHLPTEMHVRRILTCKENSTTRFWPIVRDDELVFVGTKETSLKPILPTVEDSPFQASLDLSILIELASGERLGKNAPGHDCHRQRLELVRRHHSKLLLTRVR